MLRHSDVNIVCERCKHSSLIFNWNFSCENHYYRPATLQGIINGLTVIAQQYGTDQRKVRILT